jgi:hypothetical protein
MQESQLPHFGSATIEEIQGGLTSGLFTTEELVQVRLAATSYVVNPLIWITGVFKTDRRD